MTARGWIAGAASVLLPILVAMGLLWGWGGSIGTGRHEPAMGAEALADHGRVPDFSLTERSGRTVSLADIRGKVWVADFIYTECQESCPLQSAQMRRLQEDFAGEADLLLVSFTVDPEHDRPEVLARYADRSGADPARWLFLTGPKGEIRELVQDGFKLGLGEAPGAGLGIPPLFAPRAAWAHHPTRAILHSSRFVLVDRRGHIRAYLRAEGPEALAELGRSLRRLLGER